MVANPDFQGYYTWYIVYFKISRFYLPNFGRLREFANSQFSKGVSSVVSVRFRFSRGYPVSNNPAPNHRPPSELKSSTDIRRRRKIAPSSSATNRPCWMVTTACLMEMRQLFRWDDLTDKSWVPNSELPRCFWRVSFLKRDIEYISWVRHMNLEHVDFRNHLFFWGGVFFLGGTFHWRRWGSPKVNGRNCSPSHLWISNEVTWREKMKHFKV